MLVQSVARGELKTALAVVVVLAVLGALAFAIFWWPRIGASEDTQREAPVQHGHGDQDMDAVPHVLSSEAQERP